MARARDGPGTAVAPTTRRTHLYARWAALLSQGSPLGALLLAWLAEGRPPAVELAERPLLYLYLDLATLVAFVLFGALLGRLADRLLHQHRALRLANRRLRLLSDVDPLTGILSRRAVHRRLRAELKGAQRDGRPLSLLMLDLDFFKQVNDAFGHAAGDRVLRRVGRHLRRLGRATDSVGRIGGEEFLVVLPATGAGEALPFAERLRAVIGRRPEDPRTPPVTISVGVLALVQPELSRMESYLRLADAALYRAKAEGRNRVSLSPDSQDEALTTRATGGSASISSERIAR